MTDFLWADRLAAFGQFRRQLARVLPWLSSLGDETAMSKYLRADMRKAGIERRDLLDPQYGVLLTRFRSFRDWGITWRLWRGDNSYVVQHQAGHEQASTTSGYVGDIDQLRAQHGAPFPPLPQSFLDAVGPEPPEGDPSNGGCERRELLDPVRSEAKYRIDRRPTTGPT